MKQALIVLFGLTAANLALVPAANAQILDLSGQFRCVQGCLTGPPALAQVTQNGWDLNLVNEAGGPSRAWIDWPGHLWAEQWNEGAIYSPDGMTIQFDRGTVWQRVVEQPPPPPPPTVRKAKRPQ